MLTFILVLFFAIIFRVPSDWVRDASTDTQLILFCLFVINDMRILKAWIFSSDGK